MEPGLLTGKMTGTLRGGSQMAALPSSGGPAGKPAARSHRLFPDFGFSPQSVPVSLCDV